MTEGNVAPTFRHYERRPFDRDRCTRCGLCFHHCPVVHLPLDQAGQEMDRLLAGQPSPLLRRCTSCLACNLYCPEDCRPANLILDLWHAAYEREGLPARAAHLLPHSRPNFRTAIVHRLPAVERAAVARWRRDDPTPTFLFPGCNLVTTPYLTFSPLFDGLEIRGGLDYCCGEMLFRMGLYEAVEGVARRLTAWFRRLGARDVFLVCTAGLHMLRHVLPQFGADFDGIRFHSYLEVILARLEAGDPSGLLPAGRPLGPVRPLDLTVTIQDSCHARVVEPGYAGLPRRLLAAVGVSVVEAPHHHDSQLCCGIGGGFSHAAAYHPLDLLLSARATSRDQRRTPAGATCVYCSGCLEMMSVARWVDPNRRPIYHLLELLHMALGDTHSEASPRGTGRPGALARQFILDSTRRQFPALLDPRRFRLPELPVEPDGAEPL